MRQPDAVLHVETAAIYVSLRTELARPHSRGKAVDGRHKNPLSVVYVVCESPLPRVMNDTAYDGEVFNIALCDSIDTRSILDNKDNYWIRTSYIMLVLQLAYHAILVGKQGLNSLSLKLSS